MLVSVGGVRGVPLVGLGLRDGRCCVSKNPRANIARKDDCADLCFASSTATLYHER